MGGYMELVQTGHSSSSLMLVVGEIPGAGVAPLNAAPPWGLANWWCRWDGSSSSIPSHDDTYSTLSKSIQSKRRRDPPQPFLTTRRPFPRSRENPSEGKGMKREKKVQEDDERRERDGTNKIILRALSSQSDLCTKLRLNATCLPTAIQRWRRKRLRLLERAHIILFWMRTADCNCNEIYFYFVYYLRNLILTYCNSQCNFKCSFGILK